MFNDEKLKNVFLSPTIHLLLVLVESNFGPGNF
jgi:hypothetical protein